MLNAKIMFILSVTFFITDITWAHKVATPAPVVSSELLEFVGKGDQKMIDFAKTADFSGVITRVNEKDDLRMVDLYEFNDFQAVPMDKVLCEKILARIFGPLDKISLKLKTIEIYTSHTGKTCEAQLDDEDNEAKIPERRVIVGFLNAKLRALVVKMSKKSGPQEQKGLRKFWDTLR